MNQASGARSMSFSSTRNGSNAERRSALSSLPIETQTSVYTTSAPVIASSASPAVPAPAGKSSRP